MDVNEYMEERQKILEQCNIRVRNDISSNQSDLNESMHNEPACK